MHVLRHNSTGRGLACRCLPFCACSQERRSKEVNEAKVRREQRISGRSAHFRGSGDNLLFCQYLAQPAWDSGFTHQRSSVSSRRPHGYFTPMFSPALSESSLAHDSGPLVLLGVGLDVGLSFVAPPDKRRGRTHFHPLLCLAEASCLGHPFRNRHVAPAGTSFLAEACELRVQSLRSIFLVLSGSTPISRRRGSIRALCIHLNQATNLFQLSLSPRTFFAMDQTTNGLPFARHARRYDQSKSPLFCSARSPI